MRTHSTDPSFLLLSLSYQVQEAGYLNVDMRTALWEKKGKVLEAQDGMSNPGLKVLEEEDRRWRQNRKKNPKKWEK